MRLALALNAILLLQCVWGEVVLTTAQPQELPQARASVAPLERCNHVARVLRRQHPKSTLPARGDNVRGANQVAILEKLIGLATYVIKHNADASASVYERTTEVSGNGLREALCLRADKPLKIEIRMPPTVKLQVDLIVRF
jgi:hypothetical protein